MTRKFLLLLLTCLLLTQPACADRFDKGMAAFQKHDYKAAYKLLAPLAEKGNPGAQVKVAVLYYKGWGVAQDVNKAWALSGAAAEQGDPEAQGMQFMMGLDLFKGALRKTWPSLVMVLLLLVGGTVAWIKRTGTGETRPGDIVYDDGA